MKTSLAQVFLDLKLPVDVRILDVACGAGIVAEELRKENYVNIDGLDPVIGYLEVSQSKKLYQISIESDTYDVIIVAAGFFPGLISPKAFPELIRITKPGGLIMWNVAEDRDHFPKEYGNHDEIVTSLVNDKSWSYFCPIKTFDELLFSDSGAAYLSGYHSSGMDTKGNVFIMKKK